MAGDPIQQVEQQQVDERELQYKNFTIDQYHNMQKAPGSVGEAARLEYYSGEIKDADADRCTFFTVQQYHAMLPLAPVYDRIDFSDT